VCRFLFATLTTLGVAWSPITAGADLHISDGYVRLVPPVAQTSAAFMQLSNPSGVPVTIVAASSPVAERTELHDHIRDGEIMRMRKIESLEIPAGGRLRLAPGGLHMMLIGLLRPLVEGQQVDLELMTGDGDRIKVSLPVVRGR